MSQLIDNFQTTSIGKRGVASTPAANISASSPGGLAFMRSPFAKVTKSLFVTVSGGQGCVCVGGGGANEVWVR